MPAQTSKSPLMAKYGNRLDKALKEHANDETTYGLQRLPPNIVGGIARLVECGVFPSDNERFKGEYYFRGVGVILSPKSVIHNGNEIVVEGQQTSVVEMICDTTDTNGKKTTLEEHAARIANELRKLGADPSTLAEGISAFEGICAELKEAGPYFKFSTSEGRESIDPKTKKPRSPKVFENWHGTKGLEDYVPDSHNGTDVRTGVVESTQTGETPDPEGAGSLGGDDAPDLDALLADAKGKNLNDSQAKLEGLAIAAGKTQEEVNNATDWDEVVGWIQGEPEDTQEEPAAEEAAAYEPSKGDPVKVEVLKDPKNPKKGSKNIEVEVLTVNKKAKTVTLKILETGKPMMDSTGKKPKEVEWDSLLVD